MIDSTSPFVPSGRKARHARIEGGSIADDVGISARPRTPRFAGFRPQPSSNSTISNRSCVQAGGDVEPIT